PNRRCWASWPHLGERWPARLVATAEEGRLSFRRGVPRFCSRFDDDEDAVVVAVAEPVEGHRRQPSLLDDGLGIVDTENKICFRNIGRLGVNSMQRFWAWAWGIASSSFVVGVALQVFGKVADKIGLYDQPGEAVGTVVRFLRGLAELPWLWNTVLVLGGFVAGMLVDWLLRKLDDSRADKRKALGYEMLNLGNAL